MVSIIFDTYFLKIFVGTVILGFAAGAIGVFQTLRKQALIGDALSHAALPGVVLAYILFNNKSLEILLLGALVFSLIAIAIIELVKKYSIIKFDASMAIILSSFFGLGNVFLNFVKGSGQAGLNKFIFGEAATMIEKDLLLITISTIFLIIISLIFWKHIKLFIFDELFYQSLGYKPNIIKSLLMILTVLVVVTSIKTIGVILMAALLITPAVSARQWSNSFKNNFILAGIFGSLSAGLGTYLSFVIKGLPTGPTIVVVLSVILFVSLLFSPKNGLIIKIVRERKQKKMLIIYHDLIHFYEFGEIVHNNYYLKYIKEGLITNHNNIDVLTENGRKLIDNIMGGINLWD